MSTVSDWMTRKPICVSEGTPIGVAARQMSRRGIRHLPVIDARGALVGGVTDFAVFGRGVLVGQGSQMWFPYLREEEPVVVDDVMESIELRLSPDADLAESLAAMTESGQDYAVVVDAAGRPVGILTEHDPVEWTAELLDDDRHAALDASVPVATVELEDSLLDVHQEMLERRCRHLVVVDRQGRAEAVIAYRDVITTEAQLERDSTVADAVSSFVLYALPIRDATTAECAQLMAERRIGCVPLTADDGRPIAIITRRDLCQVAAVSLRTDPLATLV